MFIMQSFPYGWYFKGNNGTFEEGFTVSEDPITMQRSDFAAIS